MDAVQFDASEEVVVGGSASGAIKLWVLQEAKGLCRCAKQVDLTGRRHSGAIPVGTYVQHQVPRLPPVQRADRLGLARHQH